MKKGTTSILTLLVGVALLRAATRAEANNESEMSYLANQPMEEIETPTEQRQIDTPEVVLQLKYDGGELNRIYLAQFRKGMRDWQPSVPTRTNLCTDLCSAGLGGDSCGATCQELVPVGLKAALQASNNVSEISSSVGEPRTAVCPTLCSFGLGDPLCNCGVLTLGAVDQVDWSAVCKAFCQSDRYVLGGCPTCEATTPQGLSAELPMVVSGRALATAEGWSAWCGVQCRQGHGGAACNCDRAPFQ